MDKNTPFNQLQGIDQIATIDSTMREAYFLRSRQIPANLSEMAECLKGYILKYIGAIPVGVLKEAITTATLGDTDKPISVAFFFDAAKKAWYQPRTNLQQWNTENADLVYWEERLASLNRRGYGNTPEAQEARERIEHYRQGDTELNTISLLDTLAEQLERMDNRQKAPTGSKTIGDVLSSVLPCFNARREYAYLVMRCQLDREANAHFMTDALQQVNTDRMASHHHRLTKEEAATNPDVLAQSKRLAVLDWLRACNTSGKKPSDIITPNEQQYQQFRRKSA